MVAEGPLDGVVRGSTWWTELPEPKGSEPGYRRPVVVVQANEFTRSRIATIIAVVLTTNLVLANAPGNVLVTAQESGLPRDSVINVSQIITIDRRSLAHPARRLTLRTMRAVDAGLKLVLGM